MPVYVKQNKKIIEKPDYKEKNLGTELTRYVDANIEKIVPYELVAREYRVFGSLTYNFDRAGAMDYLFLGRKYIIAEAKLGKDKNEAWYAMKVFAYQAAFCIDRNLDLKDTGRLIILNDSVWHPNLRNIFGLLDVEYIFISEQFQITHSYIDDGFEYENIEIDSKYYHKKCLSCNRKFWTEQENDIFCFVCRKAKSNIEKMKHFFDRLENSHKRNPCG